MITIITGTPGASKTLNTLKMVCESDTFKGRDIYYFNISELQLDWTELTLEEVKRWNELPAGSVIVVDEAQKVFPQRAPTKEVPQYIQDLDQHRHGGYDFVLITQNPKKLDSMVRYLVERHFHYERQFGLESARQLTWEKCVDDPNNNSRKADAVVKRVSFDKKYYGLYKSAEVHTVKKQIPFKVFAPFILLFFVIGFTYWHFHDRFDKKPAVSSAIPSPTLFQEPQQHKNQSVTFSDSGDRKGHLSTQGYLDERTPRVKDVPASAPIYDELTKPKTFPRPQCILYPGRNRCSCFTQQATPLDVSSEACLRYVHRGYFDDTKPDIDTANNMSPPAGNNHSDEQAAPAAAVTVIGSPL